MAQPEGLYRHSFPRGSGGWKAATKMPAGLVPLGLRGGICTMLSPRFWWFAGIFRVPPARGSVLPSSASTWRSPWVSVPKCPLSLRTPNDLIFNVIASVKTLSPNTVSF